VLTIGEAIGLSGGPRSGSKSKSVALLRIGQQPLTLDLDREKDGVLAANLPVQNGDVIYVSDQKQQSPAIIAAAELASAVIIKGG